MACGSALERSCPSCGASAPAEARFCMSLRRGPARRGGPAATRPQAAEEEERRTVTVLFADLSGYTSVAERLDHETVKTLIERCLTRFASEVERFGGRVDKYIGDNVMAVFGAPVAHEDDAERAVRAAFGMQAAMAELNGDISRPSSASSSRCGSASTPARCSPAASATPTRCSGDAVNVAARLQAAAPVGGILVGERTQRLSDPGDRLPAARAAGS